MTGGVFRHPGARGRKGSASVSAQQRVAMIFRSRAKSGTEPGPGERTSLVEEVLGFANVVDDSDGVGVGVMITVVFAVAVAGGGGGYGGHGGVVVVVVVVVDAVAAAAAQLPLDAFC